MPADDELTRDGVGRDLLRLWQPRRGYRFNTDSVLLAAGAAGVPGTGLALDAGAGCGVVGLYVAKVTKRPVVLVERQDTMVALAGRNAADNGLGNAWAMRADFRALPVRDGSVELLMSNPPYRDPADGRLSPDPQRRLSNHAFHGGAVDVAAEAERVLSARGWLVMVGPLEHMEALQPRGLHARRFLALGAEPDRPSRALVAWGRASGPCTRETRAVREANGPARWLQDVLEGRVRSLF